MSEKIIERDELAEPEIFSIASPQPVTGLDQVRAMRPAMIFYATATCWWTANPDDLYHHQPSGLPCDPRGCTLFQTDDIEGFLQAAEGTPGHYGKHGLAAFILAYHGNVVTADGRPTSFRKWESYDRLLDSQNTGKATS